MARNKYFFCFESYRFENWVNENCTRVQLHHLFGHWSSLLCGHNATHVYYFGCDFVMCRVFTINLNAGHKNFKYGLLYLLYEK